MSGEIVAADDRVRPVWFDAFLVGILAFLIFALTAQYHDPVNNDTQATMLAAWQLAHHGNATLTAFSGHYAWLFSSHGREVTNRLPGSIFWGTPFYTAFGRSDAPSIYPGALAAATAAATAVAIAFTLACKLVRRRTAAIAALLFGFGTGTWTVSSSQLWTHGPAEAAVLLTVLFCSQQRWLLAGIPAGFAVLVRPHLGIVALILGVLGAVRGKSLRPLLIGVFSAVGGLILLAYEHALWGRWMIFGGYDQPVAASTHKAWALFSGLIGDAVSPERGLLVMTPALLLLVPGLRRAWKVAPPWVQSAAFAGLGYLALQLWGIRFGGGDGFFSYRTTLEFLALCVPLLTLCWREWTSRTRLRRTSFAALAAVSVALHAFGALVHWLPPGLDQSPWRHYQPIALARHIGAIQTSLWVVGAVIAIGATAVIAWRRAPAASDVTWTDRQTAAVTTDALT